MKTVYVAYDTNQRVVAIFDSDKDIYSFCVGTVRSAQAHILFDNCKEAMIYFKNDFIRKQALAKLTDEEKEVLGLS